MTPACRNSASTLADDSLGAAVCLLAARAPATERPPFTATMGLERDTRRAIRPNLRGFPNDSRYKTIRSVAMSCSHHSSRSLPLTSALFPTDTNVETPMPRADARSSRAMPSPPDWDSIATFPGCGAVGA